jgi:NADPH-dependent glutamate synthase beta subunit-like oxidoreductase
LGAKEVSIIYRRSRAEMPAFKSEVDAAEQEAIKIQFLVAPVKVLTKDGHLSGLQCIRMELGEPDASGRPRPLRIEGSEFDMEFDNVIVAVGQAPDLSSLHGVDLNLSERGTLVIDPDTLATSVPGIFAGGDAVKGMGTVIEAIAAGYEAAISIDRYLRGADLRKGRTAEEAKPPVMGEDALPEDVRRKNRKDVPTLPVQIRVDSFEEIELGLATETAIQEAKRCLRCKTCTKCIENFGCIAMVWEWNDRLSEKSPQISWDMCVGCGVCSQVCPYGNIKAEDGK